MKRYCYILLCADHSLYTGITTDLVRRMKEHNTSHLGARYTRSRRPVQLLRSAAYGTRSEASKQEYFLKKLRKEQKLSFVTTSTPC